MEVEGVRRSRGLTPNILEAQGLVIVGARFVVDNRWDELRTVLGLGAKVNVQAECRHILNCQGLVIAEKDIHDWLPTLDEGLGIEERLADGKVRRREVCFEAVFANVFLMQEETVCFGRAFTDHELQRLRLVLQRAIPVVLDGREECLPLLGPDLEPHVEAVRQPLGGHAGIGEVRRQCLKSPNTGSVRTAAKQLRELQAKICSHASIDCTRAPPRRTWWPRRKLRAHAMHAPESQQVPAWRKHHNGGKAEVHQRKRPLQQYDAHAAASHGLYNSPRKVWTAVTNRSP
mmetsp:Transcript_105921/g.269079  ORF Transcript_105921/g.269079 Transcript_105921/m.269079 type:complete len:288 (-) Transcript_105921:11-874(-)